MKGDRWFRRLLRMLPFDMRSDYGREMEQVFRQQRREAAERGPGGVLRLWGQAVADVLAIGPREHVLQFRQDIQYALRGMRRNVGFVIVAIVTLALGIGANTAIFSAVDAAMLRPLPYGDPDRLVAVWNRWDGSDAAALSDPEYLDYSERSHTLALAAMAPAAANVAGASGDAERVSAAAVTTNAFDVLQVIPVLGRGFRPDDAKRGAPAVVILSNGLWHRMFGGDAAIVGRALSVNGVTMEVAGVLGPEFFLPFEMGSPTRADLLMPLGLDPAAPRNRRGGHYLLAFARLNPGASVPSASEEMAAILAPLMQQYPDQHDQGNFGIAVRPLRSDLVGDVRTPLLILAGAVALVLLLACANVANLMLARGESRRTELAVRTALGASRFRTIRQLLTESCVLSMAGAAAGLLVAYATQRFIFAFAGSSMPLLSSATVNRPVLIFATSLGVVTGLLFGLIPAMQVSKGRAIDVADALKSGSRGSASGRTRVRRALVVAQVTLATVLVVGAGLLVKSFALLVATPSGLDPDRVLTMRLSLPASRYPGRAEIAGFYRRFVQRVNTLPGVRAAGAASGLPLAVGSGDWGFDIEGRPRNGTRYPGAADWYVVTPGYFEALRIPLKRGRLPLSSDTDAAVQVVFINEATARTLFPNEDPVGRRIRLSRSTGAEQPWRTIAGIVGDVRHRGLDARARTEMFIPYEQFLHFSAGGQARAMSLVVKTDGKPDALAGAIRSELRQLDRQVPAAQVREMKDVVSASLADRRFIVILMAAFGALALTLAAVGLYGVIACTVAQRTREMGVRIAIGASRRSVLALVVGEGVRLVSIGAVLGVLAALALTSTMSTLLYGIGPKDVSMFALATVTLVITGAFASYLPARRATRIDPVSALRAE
jgi:putative ABC transport system permease protein